ncbi:hypothetical protein [Gymnodinialimonas ceratoperidinii]|uniref:Uncharacterized protein n=1 Tax=Gymnodinialimonas ceratoperidinii TaxID=2856823 RepID=A0A8F6YAK7_9RHOB|nr:hypothetical protein [Gymnodinialimonas ceratoperidinii]QXT39111.1 hypothetical protein KYE46_14435 [Gymnodinialimonas ceratoperidinii]
MNKTLPSSCVPGTEPCTAAHLPCLVVHSNLLVIEDLRDILTQAGAGDIRSCTHVSKAPDTPMRLVIASVKSDVLQSAPQFATWKASGTPVVVLDSGQDPGLARHEWIYRQSAPFRSEELSALLHGLEIF